MRLIPDVGEHVGTPALVGLGRRPRADHGQVTVRCIPILLSLFLAPRLFAADAPIRLTIERSSGSAGVAEISCAASRGTLYRLYESRDLAAWKVRQTRVAAEEVMHLAIPTDEAVGVFFRLEIIPIRPLETMVWVEPGEFVMGSPFDEVGRYLDKEEPQTHVTFTRGYWICRYEVTQGEYQTVVGFNPSLFKGDPQRPVENVTWFNAVDYCTKLTVLERQAGNLPDGFAYRLPTEAEWEYAARAGTTTRFSYGDDPDYQLLGDYAWYGGNSGLRTHPVGQKLPNPWGLYDLHGNVFEWGSDWFGQLPGGRVTDPQGPSGGTDRIIRGGYWDSVPAFCRSAMRVHFIPNIRISYLGFRVVLAETTGH
jgi:formylglycine-generating enzyme required for sulfatase activity